MNLDTVLKGHDLFRSFTVEEAHQISEFSAVRKYQANEMVFEYGVGAGHVYMLMSGAVYLRLPAQDQDLSLVIANVKQGELFGLSPLLGSKKYTASGQATEDTEVLSIDAAAFRELLRSNEHVGFNVMNQVAHIYFTRYIKLLNNLQAIVHDIALIHD